MLPVAVGYDVQARVGWSNEPYRIQPICDGGRCETRVRAGDDTGPLEPFDPEATFLRSRQVYVRLLDVGVVDVRIILINEATGGRATVDLGSFEVYVPDRLDATCNIFSADAYFACGATDPPAGEKRAVFTATAGGIVVAAPLAVTIDGSGPDGDSVVCGLETEGSRGIPFPSTFCAFRGGRTGTVTAEAHYDILTATTDVDL